VKEEEPPREGSGEGRDIVRPEEEAIDVNWRGELWAAAL
jgi:hypothetical protein